MGRGPADGRPVRVRRIPGGPPPVPGQSEGATPGRGRRPARAGVPPGPLVARLDLGNSPRPPASPNGEGRLRRFVRRYGWRADPVPPLIVATLATLVDLAVGASAVQSPPAGRAREALRPATLPLRSAPQCGTARPPAPVLRPAPAWEQRPARGSAVRSPAGVGPRGSFMSSSHAGNRSAQFGGCAGLGGGTEGQRNRGTGGQRCGGPERWCGSAAAPGSSGSSRPRESRVIPRPIV